LDGHPNLKLGFVASSCEITQSEQGSVRPGYLARSAKLNAEPTNGRNLAGIPIQYNGAAVAKSLG